MRQRKKRQTHMNLWATRAPEITYWQQGLMEEHQPAVTTQHTPAYFALFITITYAANNSTQLIFSLASFNSFYFLYTHHSQWLHSPGNTQRKVCSKKAKFVKKPLAWQASTSTYVYAANLPAACSLYCTLQSHCSELDLVRRYPCSSSPACMCCCVHAYEGVLL